MHLSVRTYLVIVSLILFLMGSSAIPREVSARHAQDSPIDLLSSLGGLESANARQYRAESEFGLATPVNAATSSVDIVTVTVLEFTSVDDATTAYRLTTNPLVAGLIGGDRADGLVPTTIDDLGDDATIFLGAEDTAKEQTAILFVQHENLGFIIQGEGMGTGSEIGERLTAFAAFMVEQDPGTEGVTIVNEGTATGGTFDLMPGRGDDAVLQGVIPIFDYDLLVSESPISMPATPAT